MEYRPQLDALRTIAVFGVLISHYWLKESGIGHYGVRLFFVLSGFLITSILLQSSSTWHFYIRRAARLWPAFYVCLFVLVLMPDFAESRPSWKWHALQLTNLYQSWRADWSLPWPTAHFWTLNVEEQFYLAWPFVIAAVSRRKLPIILLCIIAIGPLYRIVGNIFQINEVAFGALPPASFDALGAGALLALWPRKAVFWFGAASLFVVILSSSRFDESWMLAELVELGSVPVLCALVLGAYKGVFQPLEWRPLPAIGRISYGIYLYHLPVLAIAIDMGVPARGRITAIVCSAATIFVAGFSYFVIEKPVRKFVARRLKRFPDGHSSRFFYSSRRKRPEIVESPTSEKQAKALARAQQDRLDETRLKATR